MRHAEADDRQLGVDVLMSGANRRFFSDFYDSVSQRSFSPLVRAWGEEAKDLFRGRLRFDSLLSECPVLVDTQVLDGQFFLETDPEALYSLLARRSAPNSTPRERPMPIEIRSRCTSIADALVAFFKDPRQPNLRGFSLSSLTDEVVREHVKEHLETTDSGGVESWGDIFGVLKDAEVPDEDLKRLKRGWTRWVEADEQKLVRVVRWGGDFPLDTSLSGSSQVAEGLSSSTGHEWLLWVDEHRSYRSTVDIQLTHWRQEATDPAALGDLAAIEAWFNEGYNQAIATQHGCGQFEAIGSSPSYTRAAEEEVRGRWSQCSAVYLDLPPEFILGLGSLPDGSFTESVFRERQNLRAWWEQGDADSLRRALEPLVDLVFNSDLVAKPLGAMLRESLATAVARAAAARVLAHPLVPPGIVGEATVSGSLLAAAAAPEVVKYMRLGSPVRGKASETLRRAMQIAEER